MNCKSELTRNGKLTTGVNLGRHAGTAVSFLLLAGLSGCGTPGLPRSPSLELPEPVTGLTAVRTGDTVALHWTTPKSSTDNLMLRGPVGLRVCRAVGKEPCSRANEMPGGLTVGPGQVSEFRDALPKDLVAGSPRLLTYSIELLNHAGQSAGPSTSAFAASGMSPEPLRALTAEVRADGVLLRWEPESAGTPSLIRIHRKLVEAPGAAALSVKPTKSIMNRPAPAAEMTLLVAERVGAGTPNSKAADGAALDTDAGPDRTYTFSAERMFELTMDGHSVKTFGPASELVTVVTRDVFPPAVPTGLVALTVPEEHAIDFSWDPDTEPDLAGYAVYRRDVGGVVARISAETVIAASYRDGGALPGHRYFYSVTALDRDGNESGRGAEVEEGLPSP